MLRTPEPKVQARLLVQLLGQQGLTLPHQKALDIIAQLHGHRTWNVMTAAASSKPATSAPAVPSVQQPWLEQLVAAAQSVVQSADDAGCTDDLTVVSAQAIEDLDEALSAMEGKAPSVVKEFTVAGFNVEDVLSVRPDITPEEALEVLHFCGKHYDASTGLNWDRLLDNSIQYLGLPYAVEGVLEFADGSNRPVVVELHSGRLYEGTLASITQAKREGRQEPARIAPLPVGTDLKLAEGKVEVYMADEVDVYGGSSDDLRELCAELRAAGVSFGGMPR